MSGGWIESPLSVGLGWTLIHSLWQGIVIAAGLKAVLITTRSPRVRYAAACLAMVAMLMTFGATLFRVMPEEAQRTRIHTFPAFILADVHGGNPDAGGLTRSFKSSVPYLSPFWVLGVCLFYVWQAAGWFSARRLRQSGWFAAPDRWCNELGRLRLRLGVSRAVSLVESCLVEVPVVLGHFRPVILMPLGLLAGLPAEHIEAILLHELAHIRRLRLPGEPPATVDRGNSVLSPGGLVDFGDDPRGARELL
jgi:beta-lactamase regulating signal transducer with metallopeptidase domain